MYGKWEKVKAHALEADRTSGKLALNHLSAGSAGVMPYFAASGHSSPQTGAPRLLTGLTEPAFASYYPEFPRVGQLGALSSIAFEGMNTMFADLIESGRVANKTGMVAADFPGQRLIDAVIGCNPALGEDTSRYDHTTTVSYAVEVSGPSFGTAKATVTGSQDGKGFNWHATLTNQPTAYQFYSGYKQGSAGANFNGSAIPYVAEDWSVGGRPFALYVDGQQVAGSDKGGTVHHVTVLWEGVLQILGYSNYHVAGNVDLIVRTWDKDWNLVDTVYMPRGSDQRVCWGNWHILESWGDGVSRNGGTHTISLSTWEEVVSAPVPALSATQADGSPYVSGLWTNQGVEVDIAEETGYPRLFALQAYWYPDSVGNRHGLYREAPLNQRTLSFEETEETSGVGKILRACLYDTGNTGGHVWGDYLIVKIDKTNPTVEEATEDCVRAQDALSGLSEKAVFVADDGSKEAVDAMFDGKGAAFKVPESIRGKPYEVTVTDQAGNVARAAYAPGE